MRDGEPIVDVVEDRLGTRGEPLSDLVRPHRRTGEVVAVVGAPGMGKSAVLRSVARQGEATGYRVLSDAVADDGTAVFDRLAAVLREADDDAATPLSHLLDRASARRPHLVVVDDVHLLPAPALAELTELSRRLAGQPVLFVLSCDPRTATRLPAEVARRTLRPLGPASAALLLRRQPTVVAGRARHDLLRRAAGNPGAIVELAHAAGAIQRPAGAPGALPDTLRIQRRYAVRLAALPEATRRAMLFAAARVGAESVADIVEAAGLAAAGPGLWAPAVEAGLLELGRRLVFTDPLAAVALYDATPAAVRRQVHLNLSECGRLGAWERALHAAHAALGPDAATAGRLERVSAAARADGRLVDATLAAHLAAELSTEPGDMARRYVLGVLAASTVGDRGWTSELYAHAERSTDDPDLRCAAASAVAIARGREGFQRQAMDILQQAAQAFPPRDPATAVGLAVCAAVIAVQSGLPEHLPLVAGMRELAGKGRGDDGTGSISFLVPQDADVQLAYVDVTIDPSSAEQFRDLLPADGRPHPATAIGKLTLAVVADELSETGLAVQLWSGGVRGLGAGGEIAAWPEAWPAMARELIELGRWQEASIALDAAEELDDTQDLPLLRVMVIALRGTLAALRGDGATARALGESVWPLLTFECNGVARMTVLRTLALSAMASGDFDTAYRHYRTQVEAVATARHVVHASHPVLGLAMTAHRAGRTADALPLVEAVRDNYGPDPGVRMRLTLDHAFALLDTDDRTEDRFMSVVTDERAPEWLLDHALARFHFGAWLRRRRRPIEARPHLAAAYTILTDLGAVGLAESARVELRASGGAAAGTAPAHRSGVPGGWALLSPQQREVARLAAQGLRNREIGEQLELSPRTVSTHLYNCYLRLGITARHQLGDVVERQ